MKTPEEVARDILDLPVGQDAELLWPADQRRLATLTTAIAERDKRANALAEALRVLLLRHRDDRRQVSYRDARDAAIAALAAYDAEAK